MAIDITVYPNLSPRIIEINYPETEASLQELIDAIRAWEDSDYGMFFPYLIDAAGKEDLGGGVSVGITATLRNAQVRFDARSAPLSTGTVTTGDALGKTLSASGADFITDEVYIGCTVLNNTTNAMESILEVVTSTELRSFALKSGTRQDWQIGDTYSVYPNDQCNLSGGNLVSVDVSGGSLSPVMQSPNTQVIRVSSSSATLQELGAIQFSSFNGGVSVDTSSSYSGVVYPVGTPQQPVNNMVDAMIIANTRGFTTFYISGNITLDSGTDFQEMIFTGESKTKSVITILDSADVENCEFYDAEVTGILDGGNVLKGCLIKNINYVNGYIEECVLGIGVITLGGNAEAHFLDCWSGVVGIDTPIIDLGGSGQGLGLRNYNGEIRLRNKSGSEKMSIDLNSGRVILDDTITAGKIIVRGIGKITDNSDGADVDAADLLSSSTISTTIWDALVIAHSFSGSFGELLQKIKKETSLIPALL